MQSLKIHNKYYKSPETLDLKTVISYIKYAPQYFELVDRLDRDVVTFVFTNVSHRISEHDIDSIVADYLKTPHKIVIDTCMESFTNDVFLHLINRLLEHIDYNDIVILTSENSITDFKHSIGLDSIELNVVHCNMFELLYYVNTRVCKTAVRPIERRKLQYHFLSMIKNARMLRKIFHGFMLSTNAYCVSKYSFFNEGTPFTTDHINILKKFDISVPLEQLSTPVYIDDMMAVGEWNILDRFLDHCGINIAHETHHYLDRIKQLELALANNASTKRVFLTEKTYKNFYYGMPYISPGIPNQTNVVHSIGYKTFEDLFSSAILTDTYTNCVKSYFNLIQEIADMPLRDLEDLLNSENCLDRLKENREIFMEQHEVKKLTDNLIQIVN